MKGLALALPCVALALSVSCANRLSLETGGSSGGAVSSDPTDDPLPSAEARTAFALTAAVADEARLRVDWRRPEEPAEGERLALFLSREPGELFDGPPRAIDPEGDHLLLEGLDADVAWTIGLGVAADESSGFVPNGPVLSVQTRAPVFVDPLADPALADGKSPETAFTSLVPALLEAFVAGGGNVWVAGSEYTDVSLPLFGGVHLSGGFASGFLLEERDLSRTCLAGRAGLAIVNVQTNASAVVLDGFVLDGLGVASSGVNVAGTAAQLRSLAIRGCERGLKLRYAESGPVLAINVTGCSVRDCGLEGLSLEGAVDLWLESSSFDANGAEGADVGRLVAPSGATVAVTVRACRFTGNAGEGLDLDLLPPKDARAPGGRFRIEIEDCVFEANGLAGLLVDLDFESAEEWSADVHLRGLRARANRGPGVHLDLDARAQVLVHRLASSANGAEGLLASSESAAGMMTLSSSVLMGNRAAGVRAFFGNFGVVASHCLFVGNFGGGFRSETIESVALSSIAYLQPEPFSGVAVLASLVQEDSFQPTFRNAPAELLSVLSWNGAALAVAGQPSFGIGTLVEIADDGEQRRVLGVGAGEVIVDPAPAQLATPSVLALFAEDDTVGEDYRLSLGSAARGAGLSAPGAAPLDAGPFGWSAGGAPGHEDPMPRALSFVAASDPPWTGPIESDATLALEIAGTAPRAEVLASTLFVVDASGQPLPVDAWVEGQRVMIAAPDGGWSTGQWIQLHPDPAAAEDAAAQVPTALRIATLAGALASR